MIRVVGVDASIVSTGVARADIGSAGVAGSWTGRVAAPEIAEPTVAARARRLRALGAAVDEVLGDPDLLVIEGPAPGLSSNRGGHDLAGAWWAIVCAYVARRGDDVRILVVYPSKLAKYLAGHGQAPKKRHVESARRTYGDRFDIPVTAAAGAAGDVADAVGLVAIGARFLGAPIDLDHPQRLEAMVGVTDRPFDKPKTARKARKKPARQAEPTLDLAI